jgi:hypothetical protein
MASNEVRMRTLTEQEKEFEETRRCLFNSYHTYVQTHAGYLIAIVIGGITLVVSWKDFIVSGFWHWWLIGIYVALIILIVLGLGYMIMRTNYWTVHANIATNPSLDYVVSYYETLNSKNPKIYPESTPYLNMLQLTITHLIHNLKREMKRDKKVTLLRLALWLARSKDPDEIAIALQNKQKVSIK